MQQSQIERQWNWNDKWKIFYPSKSNLQGGIMRTQERKNKDTKVQRLIYETINREKTSKLNVWRIQKIDSKREQFNFSA